MKSRWNVGQMLVNAGIFHPPLLDHTCSFTPAMNEGCDGVLCLGTFAALNHSWAQQHEFSQLKGGLHIMVLRSMRTHCGSVTIVVSVDVLAHAVVHINNNTLCSVTEYALAWQGNMSCPVHEGSRT
jgi:hypothetical protein